MLLPALVVFALAFVRRVLDVEALLVVDIIVVAGRFNENCGAWLYNVRSGSGSDRDTFQAGDMGKKVVATVVQFLLTPRIAAAITVNNR